MLSRNSFGFLAAAAASFRSATEVDFALPARSPRLTSLASLALSNTCLALSRAESGSVIPVRSSALLAWSTTEPVDPPTSDVTALAMSFTLASFAASAIFWPPSATCLAASSILLGSAFVIASTTLPPVTPLRASSIFFPLSREAMELELSLTASFILPAWSSLAEAFAEVGGGACFSGSGAGAAPPLPQAKLGCAFSTWFRRGSPTMGATQ
mmetsp:Transcript_79060/g.224062  ORF Transcript_79060/g.224062 Transcript_79060/m.224062 type:complete len:212 (-) Transcript_79060:625-1260(-)